MLCLPCHHCCPVKKGVPAATPELPLTEQPWQALGLTQPSSPAFPFPGREEPRFPAQLSTALSSEAHPLITGWLVYMAGAN